jgi:hypothetical protein
MAEFVNITFEPDVDQRFANTIVGGPPCTNNLDNVVIDPSEFFDGEACGRWNNLATSFLQLNADAKFNFGSAANLYVRVRFMLLSNGRYGLVSRRFDKDSRWHVIIDTSTSTTPTIEFFANDVATVAHNIIYDFSSEIPTLTLGRWHTLEIMIANDTARIWIDGVFLTKNISGANPSVDCAGSAAVRVGYVNEATVASPADEVPFDRYIDSVVFDDAVPSGFVNTDTDHYLRTWTGNTERLELFGTAKVPQPSILGGAFPNNIPDFENARNQCWIAGIKPMRKVNDEEVIDIGMDGPTAVNFTAGSAGANYSYVITYLDSQGNESPPSPESSVRTNTTNTISIAALTPPSQAAFWRVYRRNVSAGQALFYLVSDDIALATTTFADSPSSVVSVSIVAPPFGTIAPYDANYIAYGKGRMYFGDVEIDSTRHPTRVYYSVINQLEQMNSGDWFYVGDEDSEFITGLVFFRGNLVIFKESSTYIALGDPGEPGFQIVDVDKGIGCVAHQTIKIVDGWLIWLSDEGMYRWNGGGTPELVSENIEPFFEDMPDARKPYASAGVHEELGLYLLSISLTSTTENDTILCYNYRDSFIDGVHRWTRWPVATSSLTEGFVGTGRNQRAFFADTGGKIGLFERGLDLRAGVDFEWQTGRFNPLTPNSTMRIHYITAKIEINGDAPRFLQFGFEPDEYGQILTTFEDPTTRNLKVHSAARCEHISLIMKGLDVRERIRIYGFNIDGSPIGRR